MQDRSPPLQEIGSMKWFVVVSAIAIIWLAGCTSNDPPIAETSSQRQETQPAADDQPSNSSPEEQTAPELFAGDTLERWRERMKNLDPAEPQSVETIDGLIELVANPGVPWFTRRQAAQTLGRIGRSASAAVPLLIQRLDEDKPKEEQPAPRLWAIKALALFGPIAAEATPALTEILNDTSARYEHRASTIDALARIGAAHPQAVGALTNLLSQRPADATAEATRQAESLRELAADGIYLVGPAAASAVPALIRATRDESESVRRKAALALGRMGPRADIAIPALVDLLGFDTSEAVRDVAAESLAGIGAVAVSPLTALLADHDPSVRWRAAMALGLLRRLATPAAAALSAATTDASPTVRIQSLEALWQITGEAETILPTLLKTLTEVDRQIRIRAFRLLVQLGPQARPAAEPLRALLKDDRPYVRQVARKALQALNIDAELSQDPSRPDEEPATSP
jgi:HEAT repeat protein